MDWSIFWTATGSVVAIISFTYIMLRNFKLDIKDSLKEIKEDIREIRNEIKWMSEKISKLETRVEERTMKVIYVTKPLDEKAINH